MVKNNWLDNIKNYEKLASKCYEIFSCKFGAKLGKCINADAGDANAVYNLTNKINVFSKQ